MANEIAERFVVILDKTQLRGPFQSVEEAEKWVKDNTYNWEYSIHKLDKTNLGKQNANHR